MVESIDDVVKKEVISKMNSIYLAESGRGSVRKDGREFAVDYLLTLLDGNYVDPNTDETKRHPKADDSGYILDKSLRSFIDNTVDGYKFLYARIVPKEKRKLIMQKMIEVLERTTFRRTQDCGMVYAALTDAMQVLLPSVKRKKRETGLDYWDLIKDDLQYVNGELKRDVIVYARRYVDRLSN